MAFTTPATLVPAPTRVPLPFGLFSVVPFTESTVERWEGGGVQFETVGCPGETHGIYENCEPETGLPKTFDRGGMTIGDAKPFTIYETYDCTPIGNSLDRANQVATERLQSFEEIHTERALSTGAFGQTPNLTQADELPEAANLKTAVATLEQTLGSQYGMQGVLHMSRSTALLGLERGVLERNGQRLSTKLGTPVIAGGGYAFEGIYATGAILGYRSGIFSGSSRSGDLLDRAQNNLYGIAERTYLIAVDTCGMWHITYSESEGGGMTPEQEQRLAAVEEQTGDNTSAINQLQTDIDSKIDSVAGEPPITVDTTDPKNPIVGYTQPDV